MTEVMTEQQVRSAEPADYMNDAMLAFFEQMLLSNRDTLMEDIEHERKELMYVEAAPDEVDMASDTSDKYLLLKHLGRHTNLLKKINEALERIQQGHYGYCEVTGEPIGVERLMIRPTATMTIEAKQKQEHYERIEGSD